MFARSAIRSVSTRLASSARRGMSSAPALKIPAAAAASTRVAALAALLAASSATYVAANSDASLPMALCDAPLPVHGIAGTNRERTFLAVKPDGVQRGLSGDIIARFEKRGYKLVGLKMVWPTLEMAQNHYSDLSSKPFFGGLCKFFSSGEFFNSFALAHDTCAHISAALTYFLPITPSFALFPLVPNEGPVVCMCWEGKDIIKQGRQMLGETQPLASKPGSIRGDFSIDLGRNICHGSDSPESAAHELKMWFPEGVNDWAKTVDSSVYEEGRN